MTDPIPVLIADDHPLIRKGLRLAIEEDPEWRVAAEAADGAEALALIEKFQPRIAILDIDMPKMDGFEVVREVQRRNLDVAAVFLTMHDSEKLFRAALELGAHGYILKDGAVLEIVQALRGVAAGQPYFSPALSTRLLQAQFTQERLSAAERRIVQLVAADRSSKEIADELSISYRTVENHRTNICRKLGLEGPNALLRFALHNKNNL